MLCYFIDCYPILSKLKHWANWALAEERLWFLHHIQFVRKTFYQNIFKNDDHRALALAAKPRFVDRNFMYTLAWDLGFDLNTCNYSPLSVWVELPCCILSLEARKILLVELLGEVLVYLNGDRHNSYPNDYLL